MRELLIVTAVLGMLGAVAWIALLVWAAIEDGRDPDRRDGQPGPPGDPTGSGFTMSRMDEPSTKASKGFVQIPSKWGMDIRRSSRRRVT